MADSANILSVLASLASPPGADAPDVQLPGVPQNVLQAAAMPPSAPQPAPIQAPPPEPAPRPRRSLLDTIGRISDVLAKVGGADALYQPTLDAREDRTLKLGDHDRQVQSDNLKLATDKFDLGDKGNTRLGQAARGAKAIITANPNADPSAVWGAISQQMQIPPEETAHVAAQLKNDPNYLDGLISGATDPKLLQSKYGGSVVYGKDATGKLVAYQPGLGDEPGRNVLPEGVVPIDPLKFIDTGAAQVGVGTRSGNPTRILPKSVTPDTRYNAASRERTAAAGNASRERTAALKTGAKGPDPAMIETAQGNLDELKNIYTNLNKMGAMVSTAQSTNKNVVARIRASGIGQTLEGAAGTKAQTLRDRINSIRPGLMQSLAKATGMTGKQLDSNADVKLFMQTVTDPTKSYEANLQAITGLERFLKNSAQKPPAAAAPAPRATIRPQPQAGWTLVKVK